MYARTTIPVDGHFGGFYLEYVIYNLPLIYICCLVCTQAIILSYPQLCDTDNASKLTSWCWVLCRRWHKFYPWGPRCAQVQSMQQLCGPACDGKNPREEASGALSCKTEFNFHQCLKYMYSLHAHICYIRMILALKLWHRRDVHAEAMHFWLGLVGVVPLIYMYVPC